MLTCITEYVCFYPRLKKLPFSQCLFLHSHLLLAQAQILSAVQTSSAALAFWSNKSRTHAWLNPLSKIYEPYILLPPPHLDEPLVDSTSLSLYVTVLEELRMWKKERTLFAHVYLQYLRLALYHRLWQVAFSCGVMYICLHLYDTICWCVWCFTSLHDDQSISLVALSLWYTGTLSCVFIHYLLTLFTAFSTLILKPSYSQSLSLHSHLSLTQADLLKFDLSVFGSHW